TRANGVPGGAVRAYKRLRRCSRLSSRTRVSGAGGNAAYLALERLERLGAGPRFHPLAGLDARHLLAGEDNLRFANGRPLDRAEEFSPRKCWPILSWRRGVVSKPCTGLATPGWGRVAQERPRVAGQGGPGKPSGRTGVSGAQARRHAPGRRAEPPGAW